MILTVSGKDIKSVFSDIAPLIKKSEMSSSITIGYFDGKMYVTADAGMRYQCDIDVTSVIDPVETALTVWFEDISQFIGSRETVEVTIKEVSVSFATEGFSTSLTESGAIIPRFEVSKLLQKNIIFNTLQYAVQKMAATNTLSKSLQVTKPIIFDGDSAYIKYSTVWIKCVSSGLNSIISIDDAKTILSFEPKTVAIGNMLEFHRDNAVLAVPNNPSNHESEFDAVVSSMQTVTSFDAEGIFGVVQKLYRVIGNAESKVYIFDKGIEVEVKTPTSHISKKIKVEGDYKMSCSLPLEYLMMCFNILGADIITVKKKEGLLCLSNSQLTILISVV